MLARALTTLLAALSAACAPMPKQPIPVAVLVDGDRAAFGTLPRVAGLDLQTATLPAPEPVPIDKTTDIVARARSAYAKGDFDACRAELAKLDVPALLSAGERAGAARTLVLEAACAWGAVDQGAARTAAQRIAAYGLELPEVAISPDVERLIGDAVAAAGRDKRVAVAVDGVAGGRLTLDGRLANCAVPCTIDVVPGEHVIAVDADGYERATKVVRAPITGPVRIEQSVASAELAARQWRSRVGRGQPAADAVGAALIGKLVREPRVAFINADAQLTGTLVIDGKVVARGVRARGESESLLRSLAYDGHVLQRPTLWQRPTFWIVTTAVTLLAAGALIYVVYEPDRRTRLLTP